MKLRKLAGTCDDGTCPNVYLSDRDTLVLQGDAVPAADGLVSGRVNRLSSCR